MLLGRRDRKNGREETARFQMTSSRRAIVRNVPAHFEPRRNLLRMIALHAAPRREVRRAAKHKIKSFILTQNPALPKIAIPNLKTIFEPVPFRGFPRQPNALFLRLHRDEPRPDQSPRGDHRHCPNPAAQIEHRSSRWTPGCAVPRRQYIVRRESMAFL